MADVFPNLKMAKGATSVATAGTVFGFNLAPRVIPQKGQERITDTDRMVATALSPGFKAIICPDPAVMTYAALMIARNLTVMADRTVNWGLATGGTTEALRMILGMPQYQLDHLGSALDPGRIGVVSALDEHALTPVEYRQTVRRSGSEVDYLMANRLPWTYNAEQLTWLMRLGFKIQDLISPEIGSVDQYQAATRFRVRLDSDVRRVLLQILGLGMTSHFGFNEPHYFGEETRTLSITDATKVQNVFGFLKTGQPDPSKAVRDVVAEYGWLGKDEIYHGLLTLRDRFFSFGAVPEHLQYMQNEYVDLMRNFSDRWRALEEAVGNVPSHVITQGSDVFSGGFFHLTQVNGFHKRKATQMVVEGDASEAGRWPGIGIRAAENAVVLADEKAAGYLQHRENCFVFEPEGVFIDPFQAALVTKVFWETFPASVRSDLIQHLQAHRING